MSVSTTGCKYSQIETADEQFVKLKLGDPKSSSDMAFILAYFLRHETLFKGIGWVMSILFHKTTRYFFSEKEMKQHSKRS